MIALSRQIENGGSVIETPLHRHPPRGGGSPSFMFLGLSSDEIMKDQRLLNLYFHELNQRQAREKGPRRKVINWCSWACERIDGDKLCSMLERMDRAMSPRDWQFLELYNSGNVTFGGLEKSVSRREFFEFQKDFDAILAKLRLGISGMLTISYSTCLTDRDPGDPHEQYVRDKLQAGDSNGRPRSHEIRKRPVLAARESVTSS